MDLPDWPLQLAYGRLGWAVVVAALVLAVVARLAGRGRGRATSRPIIAAVLAASIAACLLLPGARSPAHWLLMSLQWPSALLVALAGDACWRRWRDASSRSSPAGSAGGPRAPWLPPAWAWTISLAGALLYLDVSGWIAIGLYPAGFGPVVAPVLALLLAGGCLAALVRGVARERAAVLLVALLAYSIGRLPTGNLWDAMFDPLLWLASVASVLNAGRARWRQRRAPASAEPVIEGSPTA